MVHCLVNILETFNALGWKIDNLILKDIVVETRESKNYLKIQNVHQKVLVREKVALEKKRVCEMEIQVLCVKAMLLNPHVKLELYFGSKVVLSMDRVLDIQIRYNRIFKPVGEMHMVDYLSLENVQIVGKMSLPKMEMDLENAGRMHQYVYVNHCILEGVENVKNEPIDLLSVFNMAWKRYYIEPMLAKNSRLSKLVVPAMFVLNIIMSENEQYGVFQVNDKSLQWTVQDKTWVIRLIHSFIKVDFFFKCIE